MIDRRVFIYGAAGVAAAFASVPPRAGARPAAGPSGVAPDVVLVDRHLEVLRQAPGPVGNTSGHVAAGPVNPGTARLGCFVVRPALIVEDRLCLQ